MKNWSRIAIHVPAVLVLTAGVAFAGPSSHDPWKLKQVRVDGSAITDAPGKCEFCHTLKSTEGEPGTSYINSAARALQANKAILKGGANFVQSDKLGCVFCHSNPLPGQDGNMDDVLADFLNTTIKHPVGRKVVTAGGANTQNEYISSLDTSAYSDELRCVDCHDTTLLTYPTHEGRTTDPEQLPATWTGTWDKTVNANALQNVAAVGDADKKHCVDTCHGSSVTGGNSATRPKMKHYDWGGYDGTNIYDPAGLPMKSTASASCTSCHDTHTSTKANLAQDGLDLGEPDGRTAIDEGDCTTICHQSASFASHGHGAYGFDCLSCHTVSISHRDTSSEKNKRRLGFPYDTTLATLTKNLAADGLDNDMNGVKDDAGETAFVYAKNGICRTCHSGKTNHGGAATTAGCLDCHDVHGNAADADRDGVVDATDNAVMLRSTIQGESAVFTADDRANGTLFRQADANGLCDNAACHARITTDLGADHKGGPIDDGTDCNSCHTMGHGAGAPNSDNAFKVTRCDGCHGYPPVSDMTGKGVSGNYADAKIENYAGGGAGHDAVDHVAPTVTGANAWTPCLKCHPDTSHSQGGSTVSRANVQVVVNATYDDKAPAAASFTPGASPAAAVCANVGCHGGQTTPPWSGGAITVATQCTACHAAEAVASQAAASQWNSAYSGLHARTGSASLENHTAADASAGDLQDSAQCTDCHGLPAQHFTGLETSAMDPLTDADFVSTWDGAGGNISAGGCKVTCHSDTSAGTPRWTRTWTTTVVATDGTECANCHGTWTGWVAGVSHRTDSGPQNTHGTHVTYPKLGCDECHAIGDASYDFSPKWDTDPTATDTSMHGNEKIELNASGSNVARGAGADAGNTGCDTCHNAFDGTAPTKHSFPTTPWTFATVNNGQYSGCTGCHGTTTGGFWPDATATTGVTAYPDRAGRHPAHVTEIVARLNADNAWSTDGGTDRTVTPTFTLSQGDQQQVCDFCHNDPVGFGQTNHYPAGYGASIATRISAQPASVGSFNPLWNGAATDADGGVSPSTYDNGTGALTGGGGVCTAVDCHNNRTTTGTAGVDFRWYGTDASACVMCHVDVPADTPHVRHTGTSTRAAGGAIACASCHDAATSWSGPTPPATGHLNGTFSVAGAVPFTYGGTYPSAKGGCGVFVCHNDGKNAPTYNGGAGSYLWGTTIGGIGSCSDCHRDEAALLGTGSHQAHLQTTTNALGGPIVCDGCHGAGPAAANTHANGTINLAGQAAGYDGDRVVVGHNSDTGTCGINTCHNNGQAAAAPAYAWGTTIAGSCADCHPAAPATQAHGAHLNGSATFGIAIDCDDCHGAGAAQQAGHANGSVTLSGLTYTGGDLLVTALGGTFGSCGQNACHTNGATGGPLTANYPWSTTLTNCDVCHGYSATLGNAHPEHVNNGYTGAACTDCHTAAPAATHIDGSTNLDAAKVAYSKLASFANDAGASGTCTTTACHNRGAAPSAGWDTTGDLTCDACHYQSDTPTRVGNTAHFAPLGQTHNAHFDRSKTCVQCHGDKPPTTAHITNRTSLAGGAVAASGEAAVPFSGTVPPATTYVFDADGANNIPGDADDHTCGSASNNGRGCHATGVPDWDAADNAGGVPLACRNCHTNTTTAAVNPTSGLHNVTAANVTPHNHTLGTAGCTECHATLTATPVSHMNGTWEADQAGNTQSRFLTRSGLTFTDNAPNGATCSGGGLPTTGCHRDGGAWERLWSTAANADYVASPNPAQAVCNVCHGQYSSLANSTGWRGGTSHFRAGAGASEDKGIAHMSTTPAGNECEDCHAFDSVAGQHENGSVTFSDGGTSTYTATFAASPDRWYCANCHNGGSAESPTTSGSHTFPDSLAFPGTAGVNHVDGTIEPTCQASATCHGAGLAGESNKNAWPDQAAAAGWAKRLGSHTKHVDAIYDANLGTLPGSTATDKKNNTCSWCHPGGAHSGDQTGAPADVMNGTSSFFKTMSGGTDADGAFASGGTGGNGTCTNVDCHGGTTTYAWNFVTDALAPAWSTTSGIAATDKAWGGVLEVTWNAATDAYPSNPVTYDLYMSTTNSSSAVFGSAPIITNLSATTTLVTGLTNATNYYFGVRAKDNWPIPNVTTNTDISTARAPTGTPAGPTAKTYILTKRNSGTIYGSTTFNGGACSSVSASAAANTTPTTIPYPWRGGLDGAVVCGTASTSNYVSNSSPNAGAGTSFENMLAFYTSSTYANATDVAGQATGTSIWTRGSSGTEDLRLWLASADTSTGALTISTTNVSIADIGTTVAAETPDLSTLSVRVAAGARLAFLLTWADSNTTVSANDRVMVDNVSGQISQVALTEWRVDSTAPDWTTSGVSGITVLPRGDGSLLVQWGVATDGGTQTSPPVEYDLYRKVKSGVTPCTDVTFALWNSANLFQTALSATSFQDTAVTTGTDYCYGVVAKDQFVPANARQATDAAFGQPSLGSSVGCNSCHNSPPDAGANAGSHAAHANDDGDYGDCNVCHPGATGYTNSHQDGKGQLAFDGSAATGVYGTGLTYTDNSVTIYSDANGFGILTGSAGDGVDNGSCARAATSATQCHGSGTSDPVWGSTLSGGCGACHNSSGKQASAAPTVTTASSHTTTPAGTGQACTACHSGHFRGAPVLIPLPPASWTDPSGRLTSPNNNMQTRLGIDYTTGGGIALGGAGTHSSINAKTTEAEICWGCHDAMTTKVSEFGYNTRTVPTGYPFVVSGAATEDANFVVNGDTKGTGEGGFNFGWIYTDSGFATKTSNWVAGGTGGSAPGWKSPYTNNLTMRITSAHSANFDATKQRSSVADNVNANGTVRNSSPILEKAADLRCSYCHDVHTLNRGSFDGGTGAGEGASPFLRGAYIGNPYPPDLPPESTYTYPSTGGPNSLNIGNRFWSGMTNPMPRVYADNPINDTTSASRGKGGYFIDQNSNNPTGNTAMDTYAEVGELCQICHGTSVDDMNFYSGSMWRSDQVNGHSNAAIGGIGTNERNLFDASRGKASNSGGSMANQYELNTANTLTADPGGTVNYPWGAPLNQPGGMPATGWWTTASTPLAGVTTTVPTSGPFTTWYNTNSIGTWDGAGDNTGNKPHRFLCSKCHSPHATGIPALLITNCLDRDISIADWTGNGGAVGPRGTLSMNTTANNCHAKTSTSTGWHKLAPGHKWP